MNQGSLFDAIDPADPDPADQDPMAEALADQGEPGTEAPATPGGQMSAMDVVSDRGTRHARAAVREKPPAEGSPRGDRRRLVVEADGGSRGNPGPAGYGALVREGSRVLAERAGYLGEVSNNVAEYSGLVAGLTAAAQIDPDALVEVRMDSKLVVEQMSGRWKIKHEEMKRLAAQARRILPAARVRYTWVPRAQNARADKLANAAMDERATIERDHHDAPPATSAGPEPASAARETGAEPVTRPVRTAKPSGVPVAQGSGQPVTIVLVRHGVTKMTLAGGYAGGDQPGPPLTEEGRRQVGRAAELVARIGETLWPDLPRPSVLMASPTTRTQDTAEILARRAGLHRAQLDEDFIEVRFGEWFGLTAEQIEERWPGQIRAWATSTDVRPPGGESLGEVGRRVHAALHRLAARHEGRTVVVAAHAVVVRAAVASSLSLPDHAWGAIRVPPASLTVLRFWADTGRAELTVCGLPSDLMES